MTGETGLPNKVRTAAISTLTGLTVAIHCSALGIDSIGTNALEMNVSGKMMTKPMPITASGDRTRIPSHRPIQIIADENTSSNASASITCRTGECVRQPMMRPEPSKIDDRQDRSEQLGEVVAEQVRRLP